MISLERKKAAYYTLGCKLNFSETSSIAQKLSERGVLPVGKGEKADLCVVNTCSVTDVADRKCRQAIHRLIRQHPDALVVVVGCYAQLQPRQVADIPGVDLVLGAEEKANIVSFIEQAMNGERKGHAFHTSRTADIRSFMPSCSCGDRTRYFLKVQDGCDYYCTYCTIPFARGRSRNGSIASLVQQAEEVAERGGKEIVLTGVNIGDFGRSTGESFLDLVRELDKVEGIARYRISSIEPNLLSDELIRFCAKSRAFMPHFHIPLQSGCDEILQLMHRRYDTQLFAHKVKLIHQEMPDAFIGVDVIVGARGETEEHFQKAYDFLQQMDVAQFHVFPYSERPGTKALQIPYTVRPEEKKRRSQLVMELSREKKHEFYERYRGTERPVLFEHSKTQGLLHGFTDNYIRIVCHTDEALDNQIRTIRIEHTAEEEETE